jgi:hypothetical protein
VDGAGEPINSASDFRLASRANIHEGSVHYRCGYYARLVERDLFLTRL